VNEFVEECRLEWKRLRVPDPVADEMAAELSADLAEAEAEGVPPSEVLGTADPRSFAAAWAAERAVIPPRRVKLHRRSLAAAGVAALAIVAAVGAALVIFASPAAQPPATRLALPPASGGPVTVQVRTPGVWVAEAKPAVWVSFREVKNTGVDIHRSGEVLLIVGILGLLLSTSLVFWASTHDWVRKTTG
jgi:hypothetical protein